MQILKSKTELSKSSIGITLGLIILLVILIFFHDSSKADHIMTIAMRCMLIILVIAGGWYCPVAVELDNDALKIHRACSPAKTIPLDAIRSVELHRHSITDVRTRTLASGGFLGYWGWFRSPAIGRYFAYVGKWSDTFLVELNSGRNYVISCKDPDKMTAAINEQLKTVRDPHNAISA